MDPRGTASEFAAFLERTVGKVGYLIGTRGQLCTAELIAQKREEYPALEHKIDQCAAKWLGLPVGDCLGWCEMWENGGDVGHPVSAFRYPDRRTYADYALAQSLGLPHGPIETIPLDAEEPIAVGYPGHVGFYFGGKVYQSAGHCTGTVSGGLFDVLPGLAPWEYWYRMPYLTYKEDVEMLQKGDKDPAGKPGPVTSWQNSLIYTDHPMVNNGQTYGADGSFGQATVNGTNDFKRSVGLPQDGRVDEATWAKMSDAIRTKAVGDLNAQIAMTNHLNAKIAAAQRDLA